jgi:KaiC/GvpD/RAD55 family RecA-like ATPase
MNQSAPNISKLKGVENLTEIDIALTRAFRTMNQSANSPKRICIDIISDALLQHHAVNTKRWLSALLPTLKSKGFTVLATVNPKMHPQEEIEAILSLFDGEIRVTEKETPEGTKQTLRVRKLLNQRYLEKEIVLTKEKLA